MAYLTRRGAVYYLNLRLPTNLFPRCHTLRLSLNIRHRQSALFVAASLAQRIHNHLSEHPLEDLQTLRALCSQWRDAIPAPSIQVAPQRLQAATAIPSNNSPTLATLSKLYIEEGKRGGTWRQGSTDDVERALADLFELMGDMPVAAFDVQQARLLKERLCRYPQYFALRPEFKGKTLKQVVESGSTYKTISAVTVNNRLRKLTAFMNWCKANGHITENPLAGMKVMTGSAKDARLSFDRHELTILLDQASLKKEARKLPWRYWLPLLGRATGARLEELCQLRVDDFIEHQGIWCIRIDDRREGQNLKSASSRRLLPLHPHRTRCEPTDDHRYLQASTCFEMSAIRPHCRSRSSSRQLIILVGADATRIWVDPSNKAIRCYLTPRISISASLEVVKAIYVDLREFRLVPPNN